MMRAKSKVFLGSVLSKAFLMLCFLFSLINSTGICQTERRVDALRKLNVEPDTVRWDALYDLFRIYVDSNLDSASFYSKRMYGVAIEIGDSLRIVKSLRAIGAIKGRTGHQNDGICDLEFALKIANRNGFVELKKYVLNELAITHTFLANFDKALDYNFKSLALREKTGTEMDIQVSLNNIGLVYLEMKDFTSAVKYFNQSYQRSIQSGNMYSIETVLVNIGFCYIGLNDYEEAIRYCLLAIKSDDRGIEPKNIMGARYALGQAYLKMGRYIESKAELEKAVSLSREIGSVRHEVQSIHRLCELSLLHGDFDDALNYANEAHNLVTKTDLKLDQLENLNLLATVYSAKGNYQKSHAYQTQYVRMLSAILNGERINNLSIVVSKIQEQTNLKTIKNQKELIVLKEQEAKQKQIVLITSTLLALLLVILSFLLWRGARMKNRVNHLLDQKVRSRTQELEESYRRLEKASLEQQSNFNLLGKKVKSGMATLIGITEVAKMDVEDAKGLNYISKIEQEATKLNNLSNRV